MPPRSQSKESLIPVTLPHPLCPAKDGVWIWEKLRKGHIASPYYFCVLYRNAKCIAALCMRQRHCGSI